MPNGGWHQQWDQAWKKTPQKEASSGKPEQIPKDLRAALQELVTTNQLAVPDQFKELLQEDVHTDLQTDQKSINYKRKLAGRIERLRKAQVKKQEHWEGFQKEMKEHYQAEHARYEKESIEIFFFPRAFLPRLGLSELFYWAASRHWDCFYTGQSPDVQSPKAKSIGKSGGVGGEAAGGCGVRGELRKEVTEGGGFALEVVMGGWVFENEGGCKCCQCRMCEESGPSGDEGGGGGLAQQCWGVACFGSGEVGDERGCFLAPTASHFDS